MAGKLSPKIDSQWLAQKIGESEDYSGRGIALKVSELVYTGEIPVGSQLPATRELAAVLGVAQSTVSQAWGLLRKQKMVASQKRLGSWILGTSGPYPERNRALDNVELGGEVLDTTWSVADPDLVPDLRQAMQYALQVESLHSYHREPIIPELEKQVRSHWPYAAEAFLSTEGGFDCLNGILNVLMLPSAVIAVEIPAALYLLDMLEHFNATVIPVASDGEGPLPDELQQALEQKPAAFIYQPHIHSDSGHTASKRRLSELAKVLENHNQVLIVEHDRTGALFATRSFSLGEYLPERTLYIRFYMLYGPELHQVVISGSKSYIHKLHSFRDVGFSWSSRILQGALAWLLSDKSTQEKLEYAKAIYEQRRQTLIEALQHHKNIEIEEHDGLSLWLKVPSEQKVMAVLAKKGIIVLPGSYCGDTSGQRIRVSTCLLTTEQIHRVAKAIAMAVNYVSKTI